STAVATLSLHAALPISVTLLEVLDHVARPRDPFVETPVAGADHDVGHGARLLALADRAHGLRRVPDVADDARTHLLGEARPDDEDLSRLVVRRFLAGVAALRQHDRLPFPREDRCVLEVNLALDLAIERGAVVLAL